MSSGESTGVRGASCRCELWGSGVRSVLVRQQHTLNQLSLFYFPFATLIIFFLVWLLIVKTDKYLSPL